MPQQLRNIFRIFFTYSRADRNAIIILASLMLFFFLCSILIRYIEPATDEISPELRAKMEEWNRIDSEKRDKVEKSLFAFNPNTISKELLDSLDLPFQIKTNLLKYREAGGVFKSKTEFKKLYGVNDSLYAVVSNFLLLPQNLIRQSTRELPKAKIKPKGYFDLNTVTKKELESFGFNPYQINNLVAYREAGGVFKSPDDLLKIYGMDSATFVSMQPYIKIKPTVLLDRVEEKNHKLVELNVADTTDLIQLPGIGSVYAKRIIKYRDLLGGFYSVDQLEEVYNFPRETIYLIRDRVTIDSLTIKQIRINFVDYPELVRHPYIKSENAKALLKVREKKGMIKNVSELMDIEGFDSELVNKICPYLTCR